MEWLWMPAVAIISLFVLLLCWLFFKDYTCFPCRKKRQPELDVSFTTVPIPSTSESLRFTGRHHPQPLSLADLYDLTGTGSSTICLLHGSYHVSEVLTFLNGFPQLDLHNMTVNEALDYTKRFLHQSKGMTTKVYVVTGRGLHSENKAPKVKPAIENHLKRSGYTFTVVHGGGCYEVSLI